MRIKPIFFGILVLTVFLGTIIGFQAAGIWSVSGKITNSGEAVQPLAEDVNTIKGWMTLDQIASVYNVPLAGLLAQFNLPANTPASSAIKDLENDVFSVTNLRIWLQSRAGKALPAAAPISETEAAPTPQVTPAEPAATALPTEHVAADKTVTGSTTFQDLLDWGVEQEAIRQIIAGDLPALSTKVKDYITQKGLEFASAKAALQVEVDKTK